MGRRRNRRFFKKIRRKKFKFRIDLQKLAAIGIWIFKIGVACLLAFVCVWYFGQQVSTVGDSMKPVLGNGDVVLVNRIIYNATTPKRGDIIVFKPKGNENVHYYTKRIIGLPGETVEIMENRIYIDGEKLEEGYVTTDIDDVGIVKEKVKLAGDEYFVLGDNRNHSSDSRDPSVGVIRRENRLGRAWIRIWPLNKAGILKHQ